MRARRILEIDILDLKTGVSNFLRYLKRHIDFLEFGKMGATRIFENGYFIFEEGGKGFFLVFEKVHRISRFWKHWVNKNFGSRRFTFE